MCVCMYVCVVCVCVCVCVCVVCDYEIVRQMNISMLM